jgi:hypothetical protein
MTGPAGQPPGAPDATRHVLMPGAGVGRQADIIVLILADHRRSAAYAMRCTTRPAMTTAPDPAGCLAMYGTGSPTCW